MKLSLLRRNCCALSESSTEYLPEWSARARVCVFVCLSGHMPDAELPLVCGRRRFHGADRRGQAPLLRLTVRVLHVICAEVCITHR